MQLIDSYLLLAIFVIVLLLKKANCLITSTPNCNIFSWHSASLTHPLGYRTHHDQQHLSVSLYRCLLSQLLVMDCHQIQ